MKLHYFTDVVKKGIRKRRKCAPMATSTPWPCRSTLRRHTSPNKCKGSPLKEAVTILTMDKPLDKGQ